MKLNIFVLFLMQIYFQPVYSNDYFHPTEEKNCSEVDFRSAFDYEVRNQDKMSWCYAFTTADMIGYEYQTEKLSASDIALNFNDHWLPSTMSAFKKFYFSLFKNKDWVVRNREHVTGFIKISTKRALKKGVCLEEDSPDNFLIKVDKENQYSENISYKTAMDEILSTYRALEKNTIKLEDLNFYYKTPMTTEEDFIDILRNYPVGTIFSELNNRSCKTRIMFEKKKYSYHFKGNKFFERMNAKLDREKLVAIDYHSRVRRSPADFKKKLSSLHTSTIVGRKYNETKRSCEYLVRDSYGPYCKNYHSSLRCEKGHFWLDEETLYRALVSYSYFN